MKTRNALFIVIAVVVVATGVASAQQRERQEQPRRSWWALTPVKTSRFYRIKTDLPPEEAQAYARHLDRMYDEYARRLASLPPRIPEKLDVFVFKRRVDYLYTLRTQFGIDAAGTGGMFFVNQRGSGMALWVESLPERRVHHVMQHEGFHQFAFSRFGEDLPMWVNEGLAEFFGEAVLVGNRLVIGQATPRIVAEIRTAIESDAYIPFRHMLLMSSREWNQNVKASIATNQYRQAWSMIQFLVFGENAQYQDEFEHYLRKLNAGIPAGAAWTEIFGPDVEPFESAWTRYAMAARPSAFMTALERIEFLAEGALELSRRGRSPDSLAALQEELRTIDFQVARGGHSGLVTLEATDDSNFRIPADDLSAEPLFVVERTRRHGTVRERRWAETSPLPPEIATKGLRPNRMMIEWIRDRDSGALSYQIRVQ